MGGGLTSRGGVWWLSGQVCDRKLNCGNHKCKAFCHAGLCNKCPKTVDVVCACGSAVRSHTTMHARWRWWDIDAPAALEG